MDGIFGSALVLTQNIVGSVIDDRPVVMYEQADDYEPNVNKITDYSLDNIGEIAKANARDIFWFVEKNKLKELFIGIEVPYLSDINGYNAYGVSYVSGKVNITSDIAEHPVEDGTVITDASILNPISVKLSIAMPTALYTRIYQQMYDYYLNKKKIMLKTKFGVIKNLVISEMPYELEVNTIDRPVIELALRQIIEVKPSYTTATAGTENNISETTTMDSSDADTADIGRVVVEE